MDITMELESARPVARNTHDARQGDEWNWRLEAACSAVPPELFFVRPSNLKKVAQAKAVCAACPVLEHCRAYALDPAHAEFTQYGVWAAMTERERRAVTNIDAHPRGTELSQN